MAARSRARAEVMLYSSQKGVRPDCPDPPCLEDPPSLSRSPESLEGFPVGRLTELLKRPFANLSDSLASHSHQRPDLLERHRFAALFESVVEIENLALARREILLEDPVDELAHQLAVGVLVELAAFLSREALAARRGVLFAAVDGRVERRLRGRHAARGAHVLDAVLQRVRDFVVGGFPAKLLRQVRLGAAHPDELGILIERNADAARLLRQRLQHRLAYPPHRIGDEFDALIGIELLDRLEQSFIADRNELGEIETVTLIFFYVGDDEPEIGCDETLSGFFIAPLHAACEAALFSRVFDQGKLLYVLQVLVECSGGGGAEKRLRLAAIRPRHARLPLKRELGVETAGEAAVRPPKPRANIGFRANTCKSTRLSTSQIIGFVGIPPFVHYPQILWKMDRTPRKGMPANSIRRISSLVWRGG